MAHDRQPILSMAEFAASVTELGDTIPSVNLAVYGDPGSGKTGIFSGLPDTLMLAFDPGWVTAQRMKRQCRISVVNSYEKLMGGLNWLEDGAAESYRWILADGCSILQTRLLQQFAREAWEVNPEKRVSAYQPDKPDYFKSQNVFKSTIGRLCDLPTNVVFTFHAQHGDDQDGDEWIRPHIEGRGYQVGNFCLGLMTSIGYLAPKSVGKGADKRQVRRLLWNQWRDDEKGIGYLAKDQLSAFPFYMDDPTPEEIDKLALSGGPEETAPEPAPKARPRQASRRSSS